MTPEPDLPPVLPPEIRKFLNELPFPFLLVGAFPDHGVVFSNVSLEVEEFLAEILKEHLENEAYPEHMKN